LKLNEQAKEADRQLKKLTEDNIYILVFYVVSKNLKIFCSYLFDFQKQLERSEISVLDRDEKIARLQVEIANFTLILEQKLEEKRIEFEIIRFVTRQLIL